MNKLLKSRARRAEFEETLRAIGRGDVDSIAIAGPRGDRVFTLTGAEHAYRLLIESMNEGAVTVTRDAVILYANRCFAAMVNQPLEKVIGSSFRRFLHNGDRKLLGPILKRTGKTGIKIQVRIDGGGGAHRPAQISFSLMSRNGFNQDTIGMVVTDMSEARRLEELLRALTNRVVHVQEAERGRVALELHDKVTQQLAAALYRSQILAEGLLTRDPVAKLAAEKLREMLGTIASEVERISRDLRPSILDQLGLVAVLRDASKQFSARTGIPVKLAGVRLLERLPPDTELALYRILQESLKNVEKHARAKAVTLSLRMEDQSVSLTIKDNGIGFDLARRTRGRGEGALGLLGMRERASHLGGTLLIESARGRGTEINVVIPLSPTVPTVLRAA